MMYEIITLQQLRDRLNIKSTDEDSFLNDLRAVATSIFETETAKKIIVRSFTEYHDGRGENYINTDNYPIYKVTSLYDDADYEWTSTTEIDLTNTLIDYDCGKITLINEESVFAKSVGNVKVIYQAGYSRFNVVDEVNNYIDVDEGSGEVNIEIDINSSYDNTGYSADDLAAELESKLNASSGLSLTYTVTYSYLTQKFTISASSTFAIKWDTGASAGKSIGTLMGFNTASDSSTAASHTSSEAVTGVPGDIQNAALQIAFMLYEMSKKGQGIQMLRKKIVGGQSMGTYEYITDQLPPIAQKTIDRYRRVFL